MVLLYIRHNQAPLYKPDVRDVGLRAAVIAPCASNMQGLALLLQALLHQMLPILLKANYYPVMRPQSECPHVTDAERRLKHIGCGALS